MREKRHLREHDKRQGFLGMILLPLMLVACAGSNCTDSGETFVDPAGLAGSIGYLKVATPVAGENQGRNGLAFSVDGNTLAAGASFHDNPGSAPLSGAVRIFVRGGAGVWTEEALL